jgi:DNA helicase TIP49 (TBP-interacting protein)
MVVAVLACVVVLLAVLVLLRLRARRKGVAVLLYGPPGGGKTALFFRLKTVCVHHHTVIPFNQSPSLVHSHVIPQRAHLWKPFRR